MDDCRLPSVDVLRQLLTYHPDTGLFFWNRRGPEWFTGSIQDPLHASIRWNARFAGKAALNTLIGEGYLTGMIFNRTFRANRIAYAMTYGVWPQIVDHIDGNKANNAIGNLRGCRVEMNNKNRLRGSNNTSGYKGVSTTVSKEGYIARIHHNGKSLYLGRFLCPVEAAKTYDRHALQLYGEFAKTNF